MKSKVAAGYVQGRVTSSISKMQLGGTKGGWIGERSTPVTRALGYSSAASLKSQHYPREKRDVHRPDPGPGTYVQNILPLARSRFTKDSPADSQSAPGAAVRPA